MKLVEKLRSAVSKAAEKQAQSQTKLWNEYRAILERADEPQDGDEKRLMQLAEELGISLDMVEFTAIAAADYNSLSRRASEAEKHNAELQALDAAEESARAEFDEARNKLKSIRQMKTVHHNALHRAGQAADQLESLMESFPFLRGEPMAYNADRIDAGSLYQEERERLGIRNNATDRE